ncbi:hypothetical protein C8Q79DRAFT_923062 [Trametes meyenii]|nr:hypothetical protein C8Q79DRAFT_923062 [Trametes meyenii]
MFPGQAPDWWPARVSAHEQDNPVVHGAAVGNVIHEKPRPAQTRKTRSATNKKTTSRRSARSETLASPSPSTAPRAARSNARAALIDAGRGIVDALEQTKAAHESIARMADEESDSGDNVPALRANFGDPNTLSDESIRVRLNTLDRQRVRCLRQYARSTEQAAELSVAVNTLLPGDNADFDREVAIVILHAVQEKLVAARVDGAYLDIVYRDIETLTDVLNHRTAAAEHDG